MKKQVECPCGAKRTDSPQRRVRIGWRVFGAPFDKKAGQWHCPSCARKKTTLLPFGGEFGRMA